MVGVVSFGSVNVDFVAPVEDEELSELASRYVWFPEAGETVTIDDVPEEFEERSWDIHTGGKGANQAVAASRAGAETAFLGGVGEDGADYGVFDTLSGAGVDTAGVATYDTPTGRAYVFVDGSGENRIVIVEGANGRIEAAYADRQYGTVAETACLLLQNEIPLESMDRLLGRLEGESDGPTVIFDPAPVEGASRLLSHGSIDLITPNEVEYEELAGSLGAYSGLVVRTLGEDGVVVEDGEGFRIEPPTVDVVDTTGAGDVFNGYLAARLAAGDSLREAVSVATTAAALSTREEGAQSSIPTLYDVRQYRS